MKRTVAIFINGVRHEARPSISVAAALLAAGNEPAFRRTAKRREPRGIFCGMGVCFDCLVTVDGRANIRACVTAIKDGMRIMTE